MNDEIGGVEVCLFSGRGSRQLEGQIAKELQKLGGIPFGEDGVIGVGKLQRRAITITNFPDGEICLTIKDEGTDPNSIRIKDVFFNMALYDNHNFRQMLPGDIQEVHSLNSLLMEGFLFGDCAQRVSARNIVAILPSYIYEEEFMQKLLVEAGFTHVIAAEDSSYGEGTLDQMGFVDLSTVQRRSIAVSPNLRPGLELMVFGGSSGFPFVEGITKEVSRLRSKDISIHRANYMREDTGKITLKIPQNVKGKDVYFVQCLYDPRDPLKRTEDNIMEALLFAYEAKKGGATRVTGVFPYFSYARQDKRYGRQPISVALAGDIYYAAGFDHIFTIGIHSAESEGSFPKRMGLDDLPSEPYIVETLKSNKLNSSSRLYIQSPDDGGLLRVKIIARTFKARWGGVGKIRDPETGKTSGYFVPDDVRDYDLCIVDDVTQTGGSIAGSYNADCKKEARVRGVVLVHGQFTGDAMERLNNLGIPIDFSTSIPWPPEVLQRYPNLHQRPVERYFGEGIHRNNLGLSLGMMYRI